MSNNFFTICSFFYSLMLTIIYFKRKNIKTLETKLYSRLVITNFLNVVFALLCAFTILMKDKIPFITDFVGKTLLLLFLSWEVIFTIYLIAITNHDDKKVSKKLKDSKLIFILVGLIIVFIIYALPLYYYHQNKILYSYGPSANLIYGLTAVLIIFWIFKILKNYTIIKNKKCIPIILFIFLAITAVIIQKMNPGLLLITSVETFITVIMYFTIENPDMKLLDELHKSKEISDTANEEKTLFLYNMTQELRNTANSINDEADFILESNSLEENKESAREIKAITSRFNSMTNELFDVSKIDASNIKVYNNKYNIKTMLKEVVTIYTKSCQNKNIDFRVNIDHDVPETLYGDSIGLKEVITIIMNNSIEYTSQGYIEFNINAIIKNDLCRLIFTIEDSGTGIKSEDINKIKVDDKSLSKANKLITLMNGTMMISSNYGLGTKVKVIIDQKIDLDKDTTVAKYEEVYDNVRLLMIDDSDAGIKIIEKLLKNSNIKMDFAKNGKECLEKIRTQEKYDIILLDEQLSQITAQELIKKIKTIRNFDTPVIILTKDNRYEYNDEYKYSGFSDYLLKPVKKTELLTTINKYTKKGK